MLMVMSAMVMIRLLFVGICFIRVGMFMLFVLFLHHRYTRRGIHHLNLRHVHTVRQLLGPWLHLSTGIDKHIRIGNPNHIPGCRIIHMTLHSRQQYQTYIRIFSANLSGKIILRKQCRHNCQFPGGSLILRCRFLTAAACHRQQKTDNDS